jgi:hypothetical protein
LKGLIGKHEVSPKCLESIHEDRRRAGGATGRLFYPGECQRHGYGAKGFPTAREAEILLKLRLSIG